MKGQSLQIGETRHCPALDEWRSRQRCVAVTARAAWSPGPWPRAASESRPPLRLWDHTSLFGQGRDKATVSCPLFSQKPPCGPHSFLLWTSLLSVVSVSLLCYSLLPCRGSSGPSVRPLICPPPGEKGQSSSSFSLNSNRTNLWMQTGTWALGVCVSFPTWIQPLRPGQCTRAGLTFFTFFPRKRSCATCRQLPFNYEIATCQTLHWAGYTQCLCYPYMRPVGKVQCSLL